MKLRYRILILLSVFIAALVYFSNNMSETIFNIEKKTLPMTETTLPYITMSVEDEEINLLHGYCALMDINTIRESVTPLTREQAFAVNITENENTVKKLNYEVVELSTEKVIEEGSVTALSSEGTDKTARVRIKEELSSDSEYALCLTLITSESKRVYYYTRLKIIEKTYLQEKLKFVKEFHEAALSKDAKDEIEKYLEKPARSNTSFANVTINDSYDMITYGDLKPTVIFTDVPTITEIEKDTASISLSFVAAVDTPSGTEYYNVTENYRFLYSSTRSYLYNYNRSMEAIFDLSNTSLKKSEFKLGITANTEFSIVHNQDNSIISFVRNRDLYSYSTADNEMTKVFSFVQEKTDYIRDTYAEHDIKILNMDEAGNIDFMVYGYMNRGEYEGRTGIVLYHYDKALARIEEQLYLPVNTTYQILKEQIGDFCYRNAFDVYYFELNHTVYSYNMTTKVLKVITKDAAEHSFLASKEGKFAAFQQQNEICIYDLEKGTSITVAPEEGYSAVLLGMIDQNIIYGLSKNDLSVTKADGTKLNLFETVCIVTRENKIVKEYQKDGYYVYDVNVNQNVVELNRLKLIDHSVKQYEEVEADYILNVGENPTTRQKITKRVTDQMMTEYYLSLNNGIEMSAVPKLRTTVNTMINEECTVRVEEDTGTGPLYISYSFGKIVAYTTEAGEAIKTADQTAGIVLTEKGKIIWERGVKDKKAELTDFEKISSGQNLTSLQAAMTMLLNYKNLAHTASDYQLKSETAAAYLSKKLKGTVIRAENITLDEALYYIYRNSPVICFNTNEEAVILTGYDSLSVTIFEPATGVTRKISKEEGAVLIAAGNNIIIAYVN